ncbi:MAG: deoxyribose-phosphate aldolase [Deltaproteobacteria bacterium]|nr:deoxyribose-phosphate aldolase [Deltaproteobacteria bacterium]
MRLAGYIDLTLLRPDAATADIESFASGALKYPFASLCVPPCHVKTVRDMAAESGVKVSTVAGFPLGYNIKGSKLFEAERAFEDGAAEVDMVMNVSLFKSGEFREVELEIAELVRRLPQAVIKVIIETCYLSDAEKAAALDIAVAAGARFVKTSTGFGPGAATVKDVELLSKRAAGRIGVKASGGIKTLDEALSMIRAGAVRLGTSAGIRILEEAASRRV